MTIQTDYEEIQQDYEEIKRNLELYRNIFSSKKERNRNTKHIIFKELKTKRQTFITENLKRINEEIERLEKYRDLNINGIELEQEIHEDMLKLYADKTFLEEKR